VKKKKRMLGFNNRKSRTCSSQRGRECHLRGTHSYLMGLESRVDKMKKPLWADEILGMTMGGTQGVLPSSLPFHAGRDQINGKRKNQKFRKDQSPR